MILLPAAAYIILHVLGYRYPARLWGVDQFHYYSPALLAAFVAAACGAWILAARYALAVDKLLARLLERCDRWPSGAGRTGVPAALFSRGGLDPARAGPLPRR